MAKKKDLRPRAVGSAILFLVLVAACAIPPTATDIAPSAGPGATLTPSGTPTERPTLTPVPSITPTPQPEWVTNFAQPILDAVANRPPVFEDIFDGRSTAWKTL